MTRAGSIAWGVVAWMWIAYFLNYTDRQLVFSFFPILRSELRFTDAQLGWTGSIFLWVYALTSPVAGQIGDRVSKRSLVLWSLVLWSAATAMTGAARSPEVVLGCRALIGVVEGLFMPAAIALTASAHAPEARSRAVALLSSAQIAGVVMGGSFGGWMAEVGRWREAFYLLGAAGVLYALPLYRRFRTMSEEPAAERGGSGPRLSAATLARIPSYAVLCAVFPTFCCALWLVYSWLPDFFFERFRLTLSQAGTAATVYAQGATLAGLLAGGLGADRLYARTPAARFWVLALGLLVLAPCLHLIGRTESFLVARAAAAGFGFGSGLFIANLMVSSFDVVPKDARASAVGCLNLIGGLVSGWATYLGGAYRQSPGIPALLSIAAGLCLGGALLLLLGIRLFFRRDHDRVRGAAAPSPPGPAPASADQQIGRLA